MNKVNRLKQALTIYDPQEDRLDYNRDSAEVKRIITKIFGSTHYAVELDKYNNMEAEELFDLLEDYAPILTRGALVVLTPEEVASLSWQETIDYLSKLRDDEIVATYQADSIYNDDNRTDWLDHLGKTFHENSFMRFTILGEKLYDISGSSIKISRAVNPLPNLPRVTPLSPESYLLFGTQTSFYLYKLDDVIDDDKIGEGQFEIKRAENDPSRKVGGDFFSSQEIMGLESYLEDVGEYEELFDYHRPLAAKERQRKMHNILRQTGYRAGGYEDELLARNIR